MLAALLFLVGALAVVSFRWIRRWRIRWAILPVAALALAFSGYLFWYEHRSQPAPAAETWFEGVSYVRLVQQEPRPLVIHIVTIRLDAAGIKFLVTPPVGTGEHPLVGKTTSAFLAEHQLQIALNGSFFYPWHSRSPLDYYPHVGDPVSVHGLAISSGRAYSAPEPGHHTLFFTPDGQATIGSSCPNAVQAISGRDLLVRDGKVMMDAATNDIDGYNAPRTGVSLNKSATELSLFVIDGRQPNYSEGVTLTEFAQIMHANGSWTGLHLDGGGSATLVREGPAGTPLIVNSPIHGRHPPGRERPVANHLGVYAKPIDRALPPGN